MVSLLHASPDASSRGGGIGCAPAGGEVPIRYFGSFIGHGEDREMAKRYRRLGLRPEGTLGRAYWAHMTERDFMFSGEPRIVMPQEFVRGRGVNRDSYDPEFDWWPHFARRLDELREEFGIAPNE